MAVLINIMMMLPYNCISYQFYYYLWLLERVKSNF